MNNYRGIIQTCERMGVIAAYGAAGQAMDFLAYMDTTACAFVCYNPFMAARVGWDNYTIYFGGDGHRANASRIMDWLKDLYDMRWDGELRSWNGRYTTVSVALRYKVRMYGDGGGGGLPSYLLKESDLSDDEVALVVSTSDGLRFVRTADAGDADFTTYPLKPYIRFTRGKNGRVVVIHANQTNNKLWAEYNRYRIHCNTTANGDFDWAITINNTSRSGSVSWAAGDTMSSILAQMTSVSNLTFSYESGDDFIRVTSGGYSNSTFTLSNVTGATLDDLSLYTRINGVQAAEEHRTWQAQNVDTMFPNLGFLAVNTVQYSVSGYNLSYRCGGNETRYKEYYDAYGSSSYVAENSVSTRMTSAAFAALNNSGVQAQQDLYDKYNGSWDAYMEASMVALNDTNTNGIEYQSYDNGDTQTAMIATITTMDFDGSYIPAFPAAYACYSVTDADIYGGHCHLNTQHELGTFMRNANLTAINDAMDVLVANGISVTKLSVTSYYWSVALSTSTAVWLYSGNNGTLAYTGLNSNSAARRIAYLNA